MIVPLLSAVCVNPEKLPFASEEKAVARSQDSDFLKQNSNSVRDEDTDLVRKRQLNKNEQDTRARRANVHLSGENRFPRSGGGGLAHKMAKDALKSAKVQETIRKLSRVKPKGRLRATVKVPAAAKGGSKVAEERRHRNGARHKGRRKKKRKRHHRRFRNQHAGPIKRGSSKKTSDDKRDTNHAASKRSDANRYHDQSSSPSHRKVTAIKANDSDYIDFSSPTITESSLSAARKLQQGAQNSAKLHEDENMIERLMRTTTKDPSKKGSGDQGVEYSDYYSDDEVLQDIAANKIPVQLMETPSDRVARQAFNFSSHRESGDRAQGSGPFYPNYNTRRLDLGYRENSGGPLDDFRKYRGSQLTRPRKPRVFATDDPSFLHNYGVDYPQKYPDGSFDASYPANMADSFEHPEEPEAGSNVLDLQNNSDDLNKFNVGASQQFDASDPDTGVLNYYADSYDVPQQQQGLSEENELKLPENIDVNEKAVEVDTPGDISSPPSSLQLNSNAGGENFDEGVLGNVKIPSVAGEGETDVRAQPNYAQPNYAPLQLYDTQGEASKSFPLQPNYNLAAANLPNAMEQPLGKVLQSLGISVNDGGNVGQGANLMENRQAWPYLNSLEQPVEHFISPNYLRKKTNEDSNGFHEGNGRGLERHQTARYRNRDGNNGRDGYSRRQSMQSIGGYSNNDSPTNMGEAKHNANISIVVHDTKDVANQILNTIMEELEELKEDKSKSKREGSWSTAQAGVKLDMRVVNRTIIVTLSDLVPQRLHESLLNGTWNVSGHAPFKRGSPFTLIATDNATNSLAVFVGSCRVCQGIDTIAGVWSVARQPKGCKDFQVATSVFNDIFRKTKLSSLKENQGNSTENALKHKKRKS